MTYLSKTIENGRRFTLAIFRGKIICICKSAKPAGFADLLFHRKGRYGKQRLIRGTFHKMKLPVMAPSREKELQKNPQIFLELKKKYNFR